MKICPTETILKFHLTRSCVAQSDRDRWLNVNSIVEVCLENATEGLERGKSEIQPFPPVENDCEYERFS